MKPDTLKRIENLERQHPKEPPIINVCFGSVENLGYRVHVEKGNNNRLEYLNRETGQWQDEEIPLKEMCK